ncbi:hypothetical protein BGZ65_012441 [Modicella reniformis]|uniref:Uncharacterized protein n=1 Tax=Modicella reniformis TaxID=1440133 RepID=A0A9P6MAB5_9FUNG|nr:hypothetical protein BGZ65_012441 [Modicella reniformis]
MKVKSGDASSASRTTTAFRVETDKRIQGGKMKARNNGGEDGDDDWSSLQEMSQLDTQAKVKWMLKVMELPPCWKERKVRMFGAFGVLEEKTTL